LESFGTPENSKFKLKGQNTLHWGVLGVIGKVLKCRCLNWPLIGHLDICSPSYGRKKGRESVWLATIKSRESTSSQRPMTVCDMVLENSRGELQHWFRPRSNRTWQSGDMSSQSSETPIGTILGLQLGSLGKKSHLDVASAESCKEYYKWEGGGFPRVRAVVCHVSLS
jgi:hypothetical protein